MELMSKKVTLISHNLELLFFAQHPTTDFGLTTFVDERTMNTIKFLRPAFHRTKRWAVFIAKCLGNPRRKSKYIIA